MTVFARDGIDGASVADIAESAGVAKGSVYLYFDSKEALAGDLVRHIFTYEDDGERLSREPAPLGRILRWCEAQEERVWGLGPHRAIFLHMFGHVGKSSHDQLGRGVRQLMAETRFACEVLLRRAVELGQIRNCGECREAASIVVATTYGTIQQSLAMSDLSPQGRLRVRDSVAAVLRGLGAKV